MMWLGILALAFFTFAAGLIAGAWLHANLCTWSDWNV